MSLELAKSHSSMEEYNKNRKYEVEEMRRRGEEEERGKEEEKRKRGFP